MGQLRLTACAQLRLRKILERTAPATLTVKMWGYPYLTLVALAAMLAILVLMLTDAASRTQLISSGVLTVVVLAIALVRTRHLRTQV
jgi:aromatic amino acid permease